MFEILQTSEYQNENQLHGLYKGLDNTRHILQRDNQNLEWNKTLGQILNLNFEQFVTEKGDKSINIIVEQKLKFFFFVE